MGAVLVHLDPGLLVDLAVGVATEVVAPLEHEDVEAELGRAAFGDGEAEEAGSDDDEVGVLSREVLLSCGRRSESSEGVRPKR